MERQKWVIICVDDEKFVLETLHQQLREGFGNRVNIEIAEGGEDGLELFEELNAEGTEVAVVVSDQIMPKMKGDEFLTRIHEMNPNIVTILLTGQATADAIARAVNQAALFRYVAKPWDKEQLFAAVEDGLKRYAKNKQ